MKRVLILGGGYGGVQAALTLNARLRRRADVEIVLVDRSDHHTLLTELHEVAGNRTDEDAVLVPLHDIFEFTRVKLVRDEITGLDCANSQLTGERGRYGYDYLILAGGSRPNFFDVPGLAEHGFTLWSHADAVRIKEHLRRVFALASQSSDPAERRRLLTAVVGGGGFTGVELAGELARYRRQLCREFGVGIGETRLVLVEALDRLLTVLPPHLAERGLRKLQRLGVEVLLGTPITEVGAERVVLKGVRPIDTRTLIWTGGVQGAELPAGTPFKLAKRGRVPVDEFLRTAEHDNVYVIGDLAAFTDAEGHELPALVEAALQSGAAAARNIWLDLAGRPPVPFRPHLHGVMVSVGRWDGIADLSGLRLNGVFAILMKHFINLHYLFGIGGFELCIRYLKHEFLSSHLRPGLIEGQFTTVRPVFWLGPLRLYLGYMWIKSALDKYNSGWWDSAVLKATGRAGGWIAHAVNVIARATPPANETPAPGAGPAPAGFSLISDHTPHWYAWLVERFVYPQPIFFQRAILITELMLGAMLVVGLFAFIAGGIGVLMNINFLLSTGVNDYWFLAASIAVMAGAGMSFGADRYVLPWLMRQWRSVVRSRRLRL